MKQLTQKLKDGKMQVLEVPIPVVGKGMLLVMNHFSLISAGTEGSTVSAARKSLIGKAKERPQQVKQVIDVVMQQGPVQAYRAVMKKLDAYSPLGYSSAGVVIEVGSEVQGFAAGDLVACAGGGYASHAEVVAVPRNLCVKLSAIQNSEVKIQNGSDLVQTVLKRAAYNTLGAIALQGIRQADLKLGETCVVIGLGLIGHLTCLMLRASGIRVIGIDIDPLMAELAQKHCTDLCFERKDAGLAEKIDEFTDGIGADAAIITAATDSTDPINLAGRLAKKKGKVVIVGDVATGFDRDPHYYKKELELKMSCSYGPGRYDLNYEEKGIDYPAGYVRWTENRNMKAFQALAQSGKLDMDYLTTHIFKLDDALSAYNLIMGKGEPFLGILIEYEVDKKIENKPIFRIQNSEFRGQNAINPSTFNFQQSTVNIAFIGAGSYATGNLLPNIPKGKDILLKGVMTSSGTSSRTVADKYGFEFCASSETDILGNAGINTVFIATRHDSHADYVKKALSAGKHIFVEKPLCLRESELEEIAECRNTIAEANVKCGKQDDEGTSLSGIDKSNSSFFIPHSSFPLLLVGFNRRFSPLTQVMKEKTGIGPMSMIYRINAGHIPADSWIQDMKIGGGRIVGEVCHFIDFLIYMNGSLPVTVFATALPDPGNKQDTLNINISFENGSIGTVAYFANGPKSLFKEYIEIYRAGTTVILKDFKELQVFGSGKPYTKNLLSQDKGQKEMVRTFIDSIRKGTAAPIPFEEIYAATLATFKVLESLRMGKAIKIG
ncbi:MAG: bi-domain-containing oxidoreductase [Nitrospirae bacterium]|nr:bi-domain-containing oxidoreductase [Nitrospirota bacterium]